MEGKRLKRLNVTGSLLLNCLGPFPEGRRVRFVQDGIPADARIVSITADDNYFDRFTFVIESAEFPALNAGDCIPFFSPVIESELLEKTSS